MSCPAPITQGINKVLAYAKEECFGQVAPNDEGKVARRVTGTFNLNKETYQSEEIRPDYQMADFRHGIRSVEGSINGELSPGSYADFFAASVARDFTAKADITSLSVTIAASGSLWTVTRGAGSYLADGVKIGMVVRLSAIGLDAANDNKNLLVTNVTATVLTVSTLNGSALVVEGPIASVDLVFPGAVTFAPQTGHTDDSFTFEEWFAESTISEVFTGNKVNTVGVSLPASGLSTADFAFMGKDLAQVGTSQYFTAPTAAGTDGIFAAANGRLILNGVVVGLVTGLNFNINRNLSMEPVVGSNVVPEIFEGRILVDGEFTAFYQTGEYRDLFRNEVESNITVVLTADDTADADFMVVSMPRIKVNSSTKSDGENGITNQHSFQALLNTAGGAGTATERTTIFIQDSTVTP